MESGSKTDLEWKFDLDDTQVNNFKGLVGLIVILHVIPNLNSKLGDEEKKFVEACYNVCGFKKDYDWAEVIKEHKEDRSLSLTGSVYNRVSSEFKKIPFEKLSEVMGENNFTWTKIFAMIKKLDSYCYIYFTDNFFDFKDLTPDLQKKLKQEKSFGEFKENLKKNREATMTNNRKNWIKKANLEEKKIIKSREDLKEIFTKIRECLDDGLFLYSNEGKIIRYELVYDHHGVFHFLWKYRDDEDYSDMGDRKLVLELLVDLGFSFDYENFINKNTNSYYKYSAVVSEEYEYYERDPYCYNVPGKTGIQNGFERLVQNFNAKRYLDGAVLWFDDKNKKIDFSMLGFKFEYSDRFCPIDEEYNRGFSEIDMSCVLDKFKNEEKGFCHDQNMQFFVYMMNHPCKDEFRIMKDEKKREQFYLDLMDVIAKSVSVDSISINKIFNCKERDFTKQEEEDFIKKNNLQGIEEKTINTLTFIGYTEKGDKFYWKNEKNQKLLLNKIEYAGYFWDIITRIPKDVLNKTEIKKKIKETLQKMLGHTDPATVKQKNIISLMLFVYQRFDLDLSNEDISELWQKVKIICFLYNNSESFWLGDMFRIIFKNRDKFSSDEKKKLLDEVMNTRINKFGWSFSKNEKELKDSKSELNQKIKKIQRAVKKWRNKKVKIQKVFRDFKKRKDAAIKLQTATRNFWAKRKLEKLKRQEKLKSLVQKKPETQEKIKKVILTNKLRRYLDQVKKLKLNAIKEKHSMIKITRVAKQFLTRKRKMTKTCKWLFAGFVVLLVTFMFEMFVFDVAFLSIPSILTLLVAIILTAIFLYIDHKFKIFFWKRKPPIENIMDPSIQKENLIFNDKNNLITNQRIGTIPFNPNSITNPINITENNQDSNPKPREEKNIEEENIIDTTENRSNQINLNNQNI